MTLTLSAVEVSSWSTTSTTKTAVVPSCVTGDWLFTLAGGEQTSGADISAATTTTTTGPGTTGAWTEILENLTGGNECWYSTAYAQVTGDGDLTVSVSRTQDGGTLAAWGFYVVRAQDSSGPGVSGATTSGTAEIVNLNISQDSGIAFASFDWDGGAVGTAWVPSTNVTLVERAVIGASLYTVHAAYWTAQDVGARDYGSTGAAGTLIRCVALEILPPGLPPVIDGPEPRVFGASGRASHLPPARTEH